MLPSQARLTQSTLFENIPHNRLHPTTTPYDFMVIFYFCSTYLLTYYILFWVFIIMMFNVYYLSPLECTL